MIRKLTLLLSLSGAWTFAQEQVIPRVVVGGNSDDAFVTIVRLVSASSAPVSGTGFFLTPSGTPLNVRVEGASPLIAPSFRFTVPVSGISRIVLSGATTDVDTGWMRIVPDGRAPVFATAAVMRGGVAADRVFRAGSAAGFGPSLLYQTTTFFHDSLGDGAETSFVVVNPSPSPLNVELTLIESAGPNRSIVTRVIPPNGALSANASEFFRSIPGVDEILGFVRVTGNRAFAAAAFHHEGETFTSIPLAPGPLERYSFEGDVQGWKPGISAQARAIRSCVPSEETPYSGKFSLKCEVDLDCQSTDRLAGEVEVDLRTNPPDPELRAPLNLEGIRLTARVQAGGAVGPVDFKNLWQLYGKDSQSRGFFGSQTILEPGWAQLEATPGRAAPSGFDPGQVTTLGVRLGCPAASFFTYKGPVYLDFVVW